MTKAAFSAVLAALLLTSTLAAEAAEGREETPSRDLIVADWTQQSGLRSAGLPTTWKGADFYLSEWSAEEQATARAAGIEFRVLQRNVPKETHFFLFELDDAGEKIPDHWRDRVILEHGRKVVVGMGPAEAELWMERGYHAVYLPRKREGWVGPREVAFDCTPKPLVADLLTQTNQAQWVDWIEKISGLEPVSIGGLTYTILSRNSKWLLTGDPAVRAYEFARQQMVSWGYGGANLEDDPFTTYATNPNLQNLVVTIPGQTNPGQYVLLTAHYDSRQQADPTGSASTPAPGADDNGTGSATVLEAARILRQYRFQRSIRMILFTAEEQGLIGSAAYTNDHVMTNIDGVVNLDMFGYDQNNDRCFEIHVGTLPQSLDVGNCFRDSITSYGLGLNRDFLTTGATDRSDHASFWQKNVGAIEIAENFFSNGQVGGCSGSEPNPNYHTTGDLLTGMHPNTAFDIAKTGLAAIAAMAVPIEKCFTVTPALTATPSSGAVDLQWTAVPGAATYRVLRSTQGCQGQWLELTSTTGTSFSDVSVVQGVTYQYHVEAVAGDGFCVSSPSACQSSAALFFDPEVDGWTVLDTCAAGGAGSGNGVIDPGETVVLPVTLRNDGNAALTAVTGTLSVSTPGVTVTDASAAWPDITPTLTAGSLADHFSLAIAPSTACGTAVPAGLAIGHALGQDSRTVPLSVGTTTLATLLDESFTGGIPPTWTVVNGGAGGGAAATWTTADPGFRGIAPPMSAPYAIVDSDNAGGSATQDEQLITPVLDASACQTLELRFNNQFRRYSAARADVDVSTNGGSSWTNILRMQSVDDGYPNPPNTKTLNLLPHVGGNPANVKIRFRYWNASFEYWWGIDNVKVTCSASSCSPCAASGPTPPGEAALVAPLQVERSGGDLVFTWGGPGTPCTPTGYAVYRGDLAALAATGIYGHDSSLACSTTGSLTIPLADARLGDADYFLVAAENGTHEGSYGRASSGSERPASTSACRPAQNLGACAP